MKYLGIDFGLKRVGLATSDGQLAAPLKTIEVRNFKDAVSKIMDIISSESYEKIIVGLPEGKMGQTVTGFVNALKRKHIDVETSDETLSSKKALEQMIETNVPREKRKVNDKLAAAIILQDYLDAL